MNKRIITIIMILLVTLFLILGGVWLIGRHTAEKKGLEPLTFRQFLGLSSTAKPGTTTNGTTSSVFTNGNGSNGAGNGNGGSTTGTTDGNGITAAPDNAQSSQFTNTTISPNDNGGFGANGVLGDGNPIGTSGGIGGGNGLSANGSILIGSGNGNGTGGSNGGAISAPSTGTNGLGTSGCTTADTTITFTRDEIAQLNALQSQYNFISSSLATNDQVAGEISTYNNLKLEEAKVAEMQAFCDANTPNLADPVLRRSVPTPFWHNATKDSDTFYPTSSGTDQNPSFYNIFERIFRINLW